MAELVPTTTKKIIKNQPFMLEERFTYQNVEKELLCKRTKNYCYSMLVTMVTVTSNSGVEVCTKKCFEKMANGLLAANISGFPAVGERWKAEKKYILLLRRLPYILKAWGST